MTSAEETALRERIRLLEYQSDYLRRELTLVTKRFDDLRYSAAWTLARPIKALEDAGHAIVAAKRARATQPSSSARADPAAAEKPSVKSLEDRIEARIAAKMRRTPAAR